MEAALSVLLITLGLGQLYSTYRGLVGASLTGTMRPAGYVVGLLLLGVGVWLLPASWAVLLWTLPAGLLALVLLLVGGSLVAPPRHPDWIFSPEHPAHGHCERVEIPDGDHLMPGLLLTPPDAADCRDEVTASPQAGPPAERGRAAVCLIPGAGDTKTGFKWRIVAELLAQGLTVLTIDIPGHGEYRHRPMRYPDCLSAVPAAVDFLQQRPHVGPVGLLGISLGGALAIRYLTSDPSRHDPGPGPVRALVVFATPTRLKITRALVYREIWNTYRAPIVSILREVTFRQLRQSWYEGGYRSPHTTAELLGRLQPLEQMSHLPPLPTLLVYGRRDGISPPAAAQAMLRAAPDATLIEAKKASHVSLILTPEINHQVAVWLKQQLAP